MTAANPLQEYIDIAFKVVRKAEKLSLRLERELQLAPKVGVQPHGAARPHKEAIAKYLGYTSIHGALDDRVNWSPDTVWGALRELAERNAHTAGRTPPGAFAIATDGKIWKWLAEPDEQGVPWFARLLYASEQSDYTAMKIMGKGLDMTVDEIEELAYADLGRERPPRRTLKNGQAGPQHALTTR